MDIVISEDAVQWYREELELDKEVSIRFFVRYGGVGNVPGFSLGINIEQPNKVHASTTIDNIYFFIEEEDVWYFENKDLVITYNKEKDEPQFTYQ